MTDDNAMHPTMELRWLKLNTWSYRRDGSTGQDMAGSKNVLQQKFIVCRHDGSRIPVWKDVPIVNELDVKTEWDKSFVRKSKNKIKRVDTDHLQPKGTT